MTDPTLEHLHSPEDSRIFPVLTDEQIERMTAHGQTRAVEPGEVLVEPADPRPSLFVVLEGRLRIVRPSEPSEKPVAELRPGQFSGEVNLLSGRRGLFRIRALGGGRVLQVERERLVSLVQTDTELGEILLRAFILRRVELIGRGEGSLVVVGSHHSAGTLRAREFLTRNGVPFSYLDLDRDAEVQGLLDRFQVEASEIPVILCGGNRILRNPSPARIAECLGLNQAIDPAPLRDLVVVGAGPAGLAAALYGASEGLDVLVIEAESPGGQAGASSRIENYLGFPLGISGLELSARAYTQTQKFGAGVLVARRATRLRGTRAPYVLETDAGDLVRARTVLIATGAEYRRLPLHDLARFEGAGVYYGATQVESQLCRGEEVIVVGGGNSAGQAAVFLAQTVARVHLLVRGQGLVETMSRYLIRRIEQNPVIELRPRTEVTALEGNGSLQRVHWRERPSGKSEARDIAHLFVMAGAVPNTHWLEGGVAVDGHGFIRTGSDLSPEELASARWPLSRPPYHLETTLPGVFAVGDVRGGSIKRVASAVGEGSIAISLIHQVLRG